MGDSDMSQTHRSWAWRRVAYSAFPLSQAVVAAFLLWNAAKYGLPQELRLVVVAVGVGCAIADLILFKALRVSEKRRLADRRARLLEDQSALQMRNEEETRRDQQKATELRRQLVGQLDELERLLEVDEESHVAMSAGHAGGMGDDARSSSCAVQPGQVSDVLERASQLLSRPVSLQCDHPVVNALMISKAEECDRLSIALSLGVDIPRDVPVANVDLCALFSNLLDNAIHACAKVDGYRYVRVRGRVIAGQLVVDVENSCVDCGAMGEGTFSRVGTARPNVRAAHGWGLEILDDLVRRYDGEMSIETSAGVFRTSIMLGLDCSTPGRLVES